MYALIETVGMETKVEVFDEENAVENAIKEKYNNKVREMRSIDWRNTWYDEKRRYGKVSNWKEVVEFRGCVVDKRVG